MHDFLPLQRKTFLLIHICTQEKILCSRKPPPSHLACGVKLSLPAIPTPLSPHPPGTRGARSVDGRIAAERGSSYASTAGEAYSVLRRAQSRPRESGRAAPPRVRTGQVPQSQNCRAPVNPHNPRSPSRTAPC